MKEITHVKEAGLAAIAQSTDLVQLTTVRNEYLSKKGLVASLMSGMKDLDPSQRPAFGALINDCKEALETALKEKQDVPLYDAKREEDLINNIVRYNKGPLYNDNIIQIFESILRNVQILEKDETL